MYCLDQLGLSLIKVIKVIENVTKMIGLTHEARFYALRELARRAGVSADFFRSWRIDFGDETTTVYVEPGTRKRIRFRNAPLTFWSELSARTFHTIRVSWMYPPPEPLRSLIPDFVIPFSHEKQIEIRPLFSPVDRNCIDCPLDLLAPILLLLSRVEEVLVTERDVHGRFSASMSIAFRDGFLNRPVVDEYGLALEQALVYLLPNWQLVERRLRVKLSHDVDNVGLPFNFRSAIGHTIRRRNPLATARDLFGWAVGLKPTCLELVLQVVRFSLERGLDSAVYWKASPLGPYDRGYDLRHPKVRQVISWLHEHGVETGVHPGYETFLAPDRLLREVQMLREVLGEQPLGGRQHYLRWCPETWLHWETCGLAYDSTVGYADHIGFRAGTCVPYRPWLLFLNREANLIEIPLLVMDETLAYYMGLTIQQSLEALLECVARCRIVGGVFTLLWHNTSLIDPIYRDLYRNILDILGEHEKFDWRTPSKNELSIPITCTAL